MTFDDACTLTLVNAGFGLFTFTQSPGWSGPTDGTDGPAETGGVLTAGNTFVIWDEEQSGMISPRTNTFQERVIRCLWQDYLTISSILCGPPPAAHPQNVALAVESVKFEGVVGSQPNGYPSGLTGIAAGGVVGYTFARLTIRYVPWIAYTLDVDYGVEPLVISGAAPTFKWVSDGTALDPTECPVVRQSTATMRLEVFNQLVIPDFTAYNGMINSVALTLAQVRSTAFPIGTVLLDGTSTHTILQSTGQPYKSYQCIFKYLSSGWNNFYRPSTGLYEAVTNAAGNPPYSSVDFTPLFA
jgi:hypothetical protein